jgi:hypothetical protein
MSVSAADRRTAETRAAGRCEYCRMHQALQGGTFHIEHTDPSVAGGPDTADNLAIACPTCNLRKGPRTSAPDPRTGQSAPLFNPRRQPWRDHFEWTGFHVVGKTPTGRATIVALDLNHPRRLRIREVEQSVGLFPPPA